MAITRRFVFRALSAAVLAAVSAGAAGAQRVAGVVQDAASGRAVAGAVVSAIDPSGTFAARTVTDASGAFRLELGGASRALQVRRIGFRPRDVVLADSIAASGGSIVIVLTPIPVLLDAVVSSTPGCPRSAARDQAVALWEQARLGFLAAVVAREANPADIRALRYRRQMRGSDILAHTVELFEGTSSRMFATTRSPEYLAEVGFATRQGNRRTYHAPDAEVLLHESFQMTHCFELAAVPRQRSGQVGIAFKPAPGRDSLIEISGTLWLDRSPLALRSMEFRYEGAGVGSSGGSFGFRTASNGMVIVEQWEVRLPYAASPVPVAAAPGRGGNVVVRPLSSVTPSSAGMILAEGGEIVSAKWPDGDAFTRTFGTIEGRVFERRTREPLAGISVSLVNMPYATTTGADGRYVFRDVLPGPYGVRVIDSMYVAFGLGRSITTPMKATGDRVHRIDVEMAGLAASVSERCNGARVGRDTDAIVGRVTNESGRGVEATIEGRVTRDSTDLGRTSVKTSTIGLFSICGIKSGIITLVATDSLGREVTLQRDFLGVGAIDTLTLRLPPMEGRGTPPPPPPWTARPRARE